MSFKFKDKIINLSLLALITVIFSVTFCILVLNDTDGVYTEVMKNIIFVIVGAFFNRSDDMNKDK